MGDHPEEWFGGRGPLAMAVVDEMKAVGVYVFAGGLEEEDGPVYSADPTSGTVMITDGPYVETKEFLGGFAVVDVADDEAANRAWVEDLRLAVQVRVLRTRLPDQAAGTQAKRDGLL